MALYHNRDRFMTLEIKQILSQKALQNKERILALPSFWFFSTPFVSEWCFTTGRHFMRSSIFLRCARKQFRELGFKFAFVAETQFVGFGKQAGHYRSRTQLDSKPCLFPIRVRQSSIQFSTMYSTGVHRRRSTVGSVERARKAVWEPISSTELKSPWRDAIHGKLDTI